MTRSTGIPADDRTGPQLEAAVAAVRRAKVDVGSGEGVLARAPEGFSPDHPRIDLLRRKGCITSKELGAPARLHAARAAAKVAEVWQRSEPVLAWLDANVGPSLEPPPGA